MGEERREQNEKERERELREWTGWRERESEFCSVRMSVH